MNFTECPAANKQVDHAGRCTACGFSKVCAGFHYYPCGERGIGRGGIARFHNWAGNRMMFVQMKTKRHVQRTFNAVDADLAVALGRVSIAATKQCPAIEDGQIELRTCAQFTHVEVAAKRTRRPRAKLSIFSSRHAHHSEERPYRHDCRSKRA